MRSHGRRKFRFSRIGSRIADAIGSFAARFAPVAPRWKLELQGQVVQNMAEGVCLVRDSGGMIVFVNPKFAGMFGYTAGELEGKPVAILNHAVVDGQAQSTTDELMSRIRRCNAYSCEIRNVRRNGTPFWCRATSSVFEHPEFGTVFVAVHTDISDQKSAEAMLRESERRYRETVELAADGIFEANLDGQLTGVNLAACGMLGYAREELLGKTISDLVPADDLDRLEAAMRMHASNDQVQFGEWRLRRKDGSFIPVELGAKTVSDSRIIAFVRDISARRLAEATLAASEERYRTLVEGAYDPILVTDSEGRITFANRRLAHQFGYAAEELLGKPVEILLPERLREGHVAKRREFSGAPHARPMGAGLDLRARRKDGSEFPVDISLSPANSADGAHVTAILRDVTQRKKLEDEQTFLADTSRILEETMDYDERLRRILDAIVPSVADACVIHTLGEGVLRYETGTTRDPAKLPGLSRSIARVKAVLQEEAVRTGGVVRPFIVRDTRRDLPPGSSFTPIVRGWAEGFGATSLALVPLKAQGGVIGLLTLAMAESGRGFVQEDLRYVELVASRCAISMANARLYRDALEAKAARERILGIVSHDLKNPLATIDVSAQLLARQAGDNRSLRLIAENLRLSSESMRRLISDLLDFGKIEARTFIVEARSVSVPEVLTAALEALRPKASEKEVTLDVEADAELPPIRADKLRTIQVLWNLVGNAVKFTPRGGRVTLRAASKGDSVEFRVTDTGPGIAREDLPKVFDRYWQAKETAAQGSGLGLAIAKGIVEAHGGVIGAESEPGRGCTFHFTLLAASGGRQSPDVSHAS